MNRNSLLFLFLIAIVVLLAVLSNYFLISDNLYFNNYATQLTYEEIEKLLAQSKKWSWLGYAITPIILLAKTSFTALCLSLGLFFASNRFSFKEMFRIVLEAEFIFLIPSLLKILWFLFIQTNYTLKDLQLFYPLSLLNFFDARNIEPWLLYPLQVFNVFEVAYWLLLARGIQPPPPPKGELSMVSEMTFGAALQLVLVSYGAGLLVWVALVMFLTLSYS
jgi:hypothetical protein